MKIGPEEIRFALKTPTGELILGGSNGTATWSSYRDAHESWPKRRAPEGTKVIPVVWREVVLS